MTQTDQPAERMVEAKRPVTASNRFWSRWLETPTGESHTHDWLGWDAWVSPDRPNVR